MKNDSIIIDALNEKAEKHPRKGFWKAFRGLRNEGKEWNRKRFYLIYSSIGLSLEEKKKEDSLLVK